MAAIINIINKPLFNPLRLTRLITMSAQLRAQKAVEELKDSNPYYDKYAAKIAALQKTSPEEFLSRLDAANKNTKKANKATEVKEPERKYTELLTPKDPVKSSSSEIPHKQLSDIMKSEMIKGKTTEEIKAIWLEYHKLKDVLAATLTTEQLDRIMSKAKEHPVFILPLPRSQGYEFFVLQFAANTIHFTPLLCYQVHKENAPECLNMVHYTEFKDQNLILMRGEYDTKVISAQEALCLANQLQLYYGQNNPNKLKIMEKFTKSPEGFKHMDLITELENLSIKP